MYYYLLFIKRTLLYNTYRVHNTQIDTKYIYIIYLTKANPQTARFYRKLTFFVTYICVHMALHESLCVYYFIPFND